MIIKQCVFNNFYILVVLKLLLLWYVDDCVLIPLCFYHVGFILRYTRL